MPLRAYLAAAVLFAPVGCRSSTWLKARSGAPFEIGRIEAALWLEARGSDPDDGYGRATLLMMDDDLDCDDFARDPQDAAGQVWSEAGLIAELRFDARPTSGGTTGYGYGYGYGYGSTGPGETLSYDGDEGWEGDYHDFGTQMLEDDAWIIDRVALVMVFADGILWEEYGSESHIEIKLADDEEVRGDVDHHWVKGAFRAEVCEGGGGDTGYRDYGY